MLGKLKKMFNKQNDDQQVTDNSLINEEGDDQSVPAQQQDDVQSGANQTTAITDDMLQGVSDDTNNDSDNNLTVNADSQTEPKEEGDATTESQVTATESVSQSQSDSNQQGAANSINALLDQVDINTLLDTIDTSQLSFKEKAALTMLKKLPKEQQKKILQQAFDPSMLYQQKDQIIAQIDSLVAQGKIDKGRAEAMKSQLGLR